MHQLFTVTVWDHDNRIALQMKVAATTEQQARFFLGELLLETAYEVREITFVEGIYVARNR